MRTFPMSMEIVKEQSIESPAFSAIGAGKRWLTRGSRARRSPGVLAATELGEGGEESLTGVPFVDEHEAVAFTLDADGTARRDAQGVTQRLGDDDSSTFVHYG